MDVTVNIRGNAEGLRQELNNVASNAGEIDLSRQRNQLPPSDRLTDNIRKEIIEQRSNNLGQSYRSLLNEVARTQREFSDKSISEKYESRREDVRVRMRAEYSRIDDEIENQRAERLQSLGEQANDPFYRSIVDQQIDQERERRYRRAGIAFDAENEEIDKQEVEERSEAEKELTEAIKRLTGEMEKRDKEAEEGSDPNSYINKLREQRRKLLIERDNATDEQGALTTQGRLNAVDEQLRRVMGGGLSRQGFSSKLTPSIMGAMGIASSLSEGDISGALIGGGSMTALMGGNPYVAAALIALGAIGKTSNSFSKGYDDLGNLAAYRSSSGGLSGKDAMGFLAENMFNSEAFGISPSELGMNAEEFYTQASKRIRARGMADDWFRETISGVSLERTLALDQNALVKGAQYDRYGTSVTDAISNLVTILAGIQGSGVSSGDFTRVQEKFDIQQKLMASYMDRTDNPDYSVANNILAAFSSTGVQQDSRLGSDIASFQKAIQNPMNERMKTLVYGTVADLMPEETRGRMDLVDRAIRNPENEGKIMQAVVNRIKQQFGDTNTTMGYFAFKALFPDIAPERLDRYVEEISSGKAGKMLSQGRISNQDDIDKIAVENKAALTRQGEELISTLTKLGVDLKNFLQFGGVKVFFGNGVTPNTTKIGD